MSDQLQLIDAMLFCPAAHEATQNGVRRVSSDRALLEDRSGGRGTLQTYWMRTRWVSSTRRPVQQGHFGGSQWGHHEAGSSSLSSDWCLPISELEITNYSGWHLMAPVFFGFIMFHPPHELQLRDCTSSARSGVEPPCVSASASAKADFNNDPLQRTLPKPPLHWSLHCEASVAKHCDI